MTDKFVQWVSWEHKQEGAEAKQYCKAGLDVSAGSGALFHSSADFSSGSLIHRPSLTRISGKVQQRAEPHSW